MNSPRPKRWLALLGVVWGLVGGGGTVLAQDEAPASEGFAPFSQQVIQLDEATPLKRYVFQAQAGQAWSFSAVRVLPNDTVDPILRLLDADGTYITGNDNQTRASVNARLENWAAPAEGIYTLELSRAGQTRGRVLLTLLQDANSLALSPLPIPQDVRLSQGQVYDVIPQLDADKQPIQLRFSVEADLPNGDRFGLQMRSGNPTGDWIAVFRADGITVQQTRATDPAPDAPAPDADSFEVVIINQDFALQTGDYTITLTPTELALEIDGEAVITLDVSNQPDFRFLRRGYEPLRLLAFPDNQGEVVFRRPYASAAFYSNIDPAQALPPALDSDRLYQFDAVPLVAIEELRERGDIEVGGGLAFAIPDGIIETSESGFSSFPLVMSEGFDDFVLSFAATLRGEGEGAACGMTIRQTDADTFSSVLVSVDGGLYVLPYQDGVLLDEALSVASPWVNQGYGVRNHILMIAQGDEATLFVNGVRIRSTPLPPAEGDVLLTLVLENANLVGCTFDGIWLWSLDG